MLGILFDLRQDLAITAAQAGLELSAPQVLGLQVCATVLASGYL